MAGGEEISRLEPSGAYRSKHLLPISLEAELRITLNSRPSPANATVPFPNPGHSA